MKNRAPLKGLRVLNTRPYEQGLQLSAAINALGGIAIEFPAIAIQPTEHLWLKRLPALENVHQAIFISTNAVNCFYEALQKHDIHWPNTINTLAIGNATAHALKNWNTSINSVPSRADSEHLLKLEALHDVKNQTIILVKGEGGRVEIAETLAERGANLIALSVYQRTLPKPSPQKTRALWHDDAVDIILITSEQSAENIFTLFGKDANDWLCNKPWIVISERIALALSKLGIKAITVSDYDKILSSLEHYHKERT